VGADSGDVGFGTDTPTTKLHVVKSTSGALRIEDGTQGLGRVLTSDVNGLATWQNPITLGTGWALIGNSAITTPTTPTTYGTSTIGAAQNFIGTTNANDVTVGTNNIERLRVKNTTGYVGIGTANPSTPLEVVSNGVSELRLGSRGAFGTARFSMISDKELATEWRPSYIESADNGTYTGRMDFFTNGTGVGNKFGSVRAMSITNGNVGIGTTNPSRAKLQVEGVVGNTNALFRTNATSQGISMVSDWPGLYFNSYYNAGQRTMAPNGYPTIINTDQSSGGLTFHTSDIANTSSDAIISVPERMRITAIGNVGIGTVSPQQPLHVYKNSNATKSVILGEAIQTSIGPDFQNRGVVGYASGVPATSGFGFAVGVMGIGDKTNSYYATGVYAHLGTTAPDLYDGNQALYANGNNLGLSGVFVGGDVVIGASSTTNGAILNINSTTKGVIFPRMTRAQRNAIVLPPLGVMIFQTDFTPGLRVFNGTNWMRFTETID
jgi:hypothetical protein